MRRRQWFEFNDSPWAPAALKETLLIALSDALNDGGLLEGLVDPFTDFLARVGTHEVLDVCAGAGGPAVALTRALAARSIRTQFTVCDLFPHVEVWRAAGLRYVAEPVNARTIRTDLAPGAARVIINALHHFPPPLAKAVLEGAARGAPGLFVAEGLVRNPLSFAAMAPAGMKALLRAPLKTSRPVQSALATWLTPAALLASAWDGTVSCLRTYSEPELRELVRTVPGWEWRYGTYGVGAFGRGSYFYGWPVTAR